MSTKIACQTPTFRSSISLTATITLDTKLGQIELATQLRIEVNDAESAALAADQPRQRAVEGSAACPFHERIVLCPVLFAGVCGGVPCHAATAHGATGAAHTAVAAATVATATTSGGTSIAVAATAAVAAAVGTVATLAADTTVTVAVATAGVTVDTATATATAATVAVTAGLTAATAGGRAVAAPLAETGVVRHRRMPDSAVGGVRPVPRTRQVLPPLLGKLAKRKNQPSLRTTMLERTHHSRSLRPSWLTA